MVQSDDSDSDEDAHLEGVFDVRTDVDESDLRALFAFLPEKAPWRSAVPMEEPDQIPALVDTVEATEGTAEPDIDAGNTNLDRAGEDALDTQEVTAEAPVVAMMRSAALATKVRKLAQRAVRHATARAVEQIAALVQQKNATSGALQTGVASNTEVQDWFRTALANVSQKLVTHAIEQIGADSVMRQQAGDPGRGEETLDDALEQNVQAHVQDAMHQAAETLMSLVQSKFGIGVPPVGEHVSAEDAAAELEDVEQGTEEALGTAMQQQLRAQVHSAVQEAAATLSALVGAKFGPAAAAAMLSEMAHIPDTSVYAGHSKAIESAPEELEVNSSIFSDDSGERGLSGNASDDDQTVFSHVHGRVHPEDEDAVEQEFKEFDSIFSGSSDAGSDGAPVEAEYKEFDSIFDGSESSEKWSDGGSGSVVAEEELKATASLFDSDDDELPVEQLRSKRAGSKAPALRSSAYKLFPADRAVPPQAGASLSPRNTTAPVANLGVAQASGAPAVAHRQLRPRPSRARATVRQPSTNEWNTVLSAFDSGSDSDSDSQISL
jgi:hypothetical protein